MCPAHLESKEKKTEELLSKAKGEKSREHMIRVEQYLVVVVFFFCLFKLCVLHLFCLIAFQMLYGLFLSFLCDRFLTFLFFISSSFHLLNFTYIYVCFPLMNSK